jgi:DNA repair protein RecN (Recombination protein N)
MLKTLRVKNFALIEEAEVEFAPELNLITGETGAGKSLLIGALEALLGNKLSPDIIRQGADKAVAEGEFELSDDVWQTLKTEGFDKTETVLIRREINANGKVRNFLNDSPVSLKKLSELSGHLVDLCGQYEQQTLFSKDNHLEYLDRFAGLINLRNRMTELYYEHRKLSSHLKNLQDESRRQNLRKDLINFEIKELRSANLSLEEEDKLLEEEKTLKHSEQILEFCHRAELTLNTGAGSVMETISIISKELEKLTAYARGLKGVGENLHSASANLAEAVRDLNSFKQNFDFSPRRLESIRERLGELSSIKRKFGGSIASALNHLKEIETEAKAFADLEVIISQLKIKLGQLTENLKEVAKELSQKRALSAPALKSQMEAVLKDLGFSHIVFEARLEKTKGEDLEIEGELFGLKEDGIDSCEIFLSTNPGENLRPMKDIASGGEISRILLALKSVLSDSSKTGTLIFDEIDIGISGKVARKVGLKLWDASKHQQTIVITHLPQIASMPGRHFSASKVLKRGRTSSKFTILPEEERVKEVAKLLSYSEDSGKGEIYAKELLSKGMEGDLFHH